MLGLYVIGSNMRCQAERVLDYIRKHFKDVLTALILPQATTTRRTLLTGIGQLRWHLTQEAGLTFLEQHNTFDGSHVNYAEVKRYFVFCYDERGDQGMLLWPGTLYVPNSS